MSYDIYSTFGKLLRLNNNRSTPISQVMGIKWDDVICSSWGGKLISTEMQGWKVPLNSSYN